MSAFKTPKIGVYGSKDRLLQKRLSYEKTSLTHHPINVYKYLGSATNGAGASITDIFDPVLMENPDRSYDPNPVKINANVDQLPENPFDLSKFGIINPLQDVQVFRVHVNSFEADGLGRYLVVGDVIEVPFFEQNGVKAFFEVTDVDKKTEFEHFHVVVTTTPLKDSQESEEIADLVSNSEALADLQASLDEAYDATVAKTNLEPEPELYVARGYVEDDYADLPDTVIYTDEADRTNYDPRTDLQGEFLDDPLAKVF